MKKNQVALRAYDKS